MKQLSENEKSRCRIAMMMLQHAERFRLLRVKTDELDTEKLIEAVSDILDDFEDRLPDLIKPSDDGGKYVDQAGSSSLRMRKQSFYFR
jgi:uncharacterized spore protein YtfJ